METRFEPITIQLSNPFQVRVVEMACRGETVSALGRNLLLDIAGDLAQHRDDQEASNDA